MEILTPTGYRNIEDLTIGEAVIGKDGAFNTLLGKRTFDAGWFLEQGLPEDWKWYLINGVYHFFGNQNIIVAEGDYTVCHVKELQTGWKIYDAAGRVILIGSIEEADPNDVWYKLDISGDHSFMCDGVLVHNASRFWVGGGSNNQWNSTPTSNFSATSGGSPGASNPSSSDDVKFDGVGANANGASTFTASTTILSLTFSGYTNTITINTGQTITIAGNFTDDTNHGWTVTGSGKITISAASTITSGGKTFPGAVTFTNTNTKTLSGNWVISGLLTFSGATTLNWTTNESISCSGITATASCSGTAKIILTGGTWSGASVVSNNLDIQGNVTVSSSVFYQTGTLTYISGTVTTTGSTLNINANTTLNTNGITWANITVAAASTITLNSLLTVSGILSTSNIAVTWAGTDGWTCGTFNSDATTSGGNQTFANGKTYTITTALTGFKSRVGSILLFTSDHASNRAIIIRQNGATCNLLANLTRIDASGGMPLNAFNGTITDCINCHSFTDVEGIFQSNSRIIGAASTY